MIRLFMMFKFVAISVKVASNVCFPYLPIGRDRVPCYVVRSIFELQNVFSFGTSVLFAFFASVFVQILR